jgi:hypothetical protein
VATRSHRPLRDDRVAERSAVLDGKLNQIVKEELLPMVAARNRVAVQGQAVDYLVFQKIKGGRRCSCFSIESSPSQQCTACFGTGIVGGYEKWGTHLAVWDVTFPNTSTINIMPNYAAKTKPLGWTMIRGATYGSVEGKIPLQTNLGLLDELFVDSDVPEGSDLYYYLRGPGDTDWVSFNAKELQRRLGQPYLRVKVEFRRVSPEQASPTFYFFYMRYQSLKKLTIMCDVTPTDRSSVLEEYGTHDNWQQQNFYVCDEIRQLNPEDLFVSTDGVEHWKLIVVTEKAPANIITSWTVQGRRIQYHEPLNHIPIGGGYYPEATYIK